MIDANYVINDLEPLLRDLKTDVMLEAMDTGDVGLLTTYGMVNEIIDKLDSWKKIASEKGEK